MKNFSLQNIGVSVGITTAVFGGVILRSGVLYHQDPTCRQNIQNMITCGVASGQMPFQAHPFNSLVTVSGTVGTQTVIFTPNIENVNLLISIPDFFKKLPNQIQYVA